MLPLSAKTRAPRQHHSCSAHPLQNIEFMPLDLRDGRMVACPLAGTKLTSVCHPKRPP